MKIPDKLKVGAIEYSVKQVDKIVESTGYSSADIDYSDTTIRVVKHATDDAMMQSFYHEMIHAIHHHTAIDRDTCPPSERDVDSLASALLMVVRDNPSVFSPERNDDIVVKQYISDAYPVVEKAAYVYDERNSD
jgi:Domain of unknown function (DUF955).